MSLNRVVSSLSLFAALFSVQACVSNAGSDSEEGSSDNEIRVDPIAFAGAYRAVAGEATPKFDALVLDSAGAFFAEIDTGIRCITSPCPSRARIEGKFNVTRGHLTLSASSGAEPSQYHGRYGVSLADGHLVLSRSGGAFPSDWTNELTSAPSYCAEPSDCEHQQLIKPMCVGQWECGAKNTCGFRCD